MAIGESVGDYVIAERLGQGAEGEVFLARDVLLGRRVALKTLRSASAEATHGVEEARLMAGLEHPNIVRVYHALRHKGAWLVVFEHIPGGTLSAHVERAGPMTPARAAELLAQAAAGLGYAHELGILHRDVKPQNLLLSHRGELKLGDFGLAVAMRSVARASTGAVGTPAFLAPELWAGGAPSPASDIYSLGACLYFVLTGRVPFPFSQPEQLERAHRELEPKLPAEVPTGLRQAILAMLAKDPAQRPPSCSQLALDLALLARDPTTPLRSSSPARSRAPQSPLVAGGAERGLEVALGEGPDRVYLERLLELLQPGRAAIQLQAAPLVEARALLRVALGRCMPPRRVALRLEISTPAAVLPALLRQRAGAAAALPLEKICQQLVAEQHASSSGPCVIEVQMTVVPSARQTADLRAFADLAAESQIAIVLVSSSSEAGPEGSDALPGFELLRMPPAWLSAHDFAERVRLWLAAASAQRWQASADALRLLRHGCREQGYAWTQLTQDSLLISAAARLPLLTSWAVQAALARASPLHALSEVPAEWRAPPRRWPSPQLLGLLCELRAEDQALELPATESASELPPVEPAGAVREPG